MKKLFLILLAAALIISLCACAGESEPTAPTGDPTSGSDSPTNDGATEDSVTVLLVTINPQFKLYLDAQGNVTELEAVNADAQSIMDQISYDTQELQTVLSSIITIAGENGFIDENTTVTVEIAQAGAADADALQQAAQAAADQAVEALLPDPTDGPETVDPGANLQYFVEYLGNFREGDGTLSAGAIQFESDCCVLIDRDFTTERQDEEQSPIVFNGTNYYSLGGGMEPYNFELTDTQIIVTDSLWGEATGAVTLRLTLRSDGTLLVTESTTALLPVGTVLSTNLDDVI